MLDGKKIVVVMPAYNAEETLIKTLSDLPLTVDLVIVVDDFSYDNTRELAIKLGLQYHRHDKNIGYGANQKTCYQKALEAGADIVVMVHPDYQYSPKLVSAMAGMLTTGHYDIVLASRMIGDQKSRKKGMPLWRYLANISLTFVENIILWQKLSEYHTGYRAYSKEFLQNSTFMNNSDDFVFDNQILAQAIYFGYRIGEISCPTRYDPESSSINLRSSIKYGIGVLHTALLYRLAKSGIYTSKLFIK